MIGGLKDLKIFQASNHLPQSGSVKSRFYVLKQADEIL